MQEYPGSTGLILNEPLLHFLFLGAILFVVYSMMQTPGRNDEPGEIVVTQGQIDHLAAGFARIWQRSPDSVYGLPAMHTQKRLPRRS